MKEFFKRIFNIKEENKDNIDNKASISGKDNIDTKDNIDSKDITYAKEIADSKTRIDGEENIYNKARIDSKDIIDGKESIDSKEGNNGNCIKIPNIEYGLLLDKLIKNKELDKIPELFYLTLLRNNDLKNEFVREATRIMKKLNNKEIIRLANLFRERSSLCYSVEWKDVEIDDLLEKTMTDEEKLCVVKIASLHPNGYLREKALEALRKYNDTQSFAFIVLRCNDWVNNVRKKAYNELAKRINMKNIDNIILNIMMINRLKDNLSDLEKHYKYYGYRQYGIDINRYSILLDGILQKIDEIINLKNDEVINALVRCTSCDDRYVLEYSLKRIIDINAMDYSEIIDKILKFRDKHIQFKMTKYLLESMDSENVIENKDKLEKIISPRARVIIIEKFYKIGIYKEAKELEEDCLSKYASVRDLARFYMKKLGFADFNEFYKSKLEDEYYRKYALLGLCEISSGDNINLVLNNAKNLNAKTQKKILNRLMELCSENKYDDYSFFIESLKSNSNSVVKICREYISKNYEYFNHESIYEIYKTQDNEFAKENCVMLLCLDKSWTGLRYILEFIGSSDENIVNIAQESLNDWIYSKKSYLVYNSEDGTYSHYLLTKINEDENKKINELLQRNEELEIRYMHRSEVEGLVLKYGK